LPSLCKDNKEHTQKIADILAQLLQAEDNAELSVVHNSLMTLFKSDAKGKKHVRILIAACILQLKIYFSRMQVIYTLVLKTIVIQSAYSHSSVHTCTVIFCCISLISVPTTTSRVTINHTISDASFFISFL